MVLLKFFFSGIIYNHVSNNVGPKTEFQVSNKKDVQFIDTVLSGSNADLINKLKKELTLANNKIEQLENKMQGFEERIKKPYPNVKYLNYRSKKRILVRKKYIPTYLYFSIFIKS